MFFGYLFIFRFPFFFFYLLFLHPIISFGYTHTYIHTHIDSQYQNLDAPACLMPWAVAHAAHSQGRASMTAYGYGVMIENNRVYGGRGFFIDMMVKLT